MIKVERTTNSEANRCNSGHGDSNNGTRYHERQLTLGTRCRTDGTATESAHDRKTIEHASKKVRKTKSNYSEDSQKDKWLDKGTESKTAHERERRKQRHIRIS